MAQELEIGIQPNRIAFLSFTKKATENARDRMIEQFGFTKDDMPWCRTLHSLGFRLLGLRRDEVMQGKNFKEVGNALGLSFTSKVNIEDGMPLGSCTGDRYLFLDGFARARKMSPEMAWRHIVGEGDDELNWFEFKRFHNTLREYKYSRNLLDFSDMLEYSQSVLDVDVVIVDEAQDLSTLQWEYLKRVVTPNARRIYIAGDDDQAIFQWSGADVKSFRHCEGTAEVLHQSHRVPKEVHRVAEKIVHGIHERFEKAYLPRQVSGSVSYHLEPEAVDLSVPGSWLLLARNNYLLEQLVTMVRAQGLAYSLRGEPAVDPRHVKAIKAWEFRRKGGSLSPDEEEMIAEFLPRGRKMDGKIWHEAFTKIKLEDREWLIGMLRRGESLTKQPRINISTIHGVKGGEADSVLLLSEMSARTFNTMNIDRDAEARVWYVGVTRAKQNLHIVQSSTGRGWEV